jgi:hypothetical protein
MPQVVMVVQVFVTQGQGINSLTDEIVDCVFDPLRITVVIEAGGQAAQDASPSLDLTQQHAAGIGSDLSTIESADDFTSAQGLEFQRRFVTLCFQEAVSSMSTWMFSINTLCHRERPFSIGLVRNCR